MKSINELEAAVKAEEAGLRNAEIEHAIATETAKRLLAEIADVTLFNANGTEDLTEAIGVLQYTKFEVSRFTSRLQTAQRKVRSYRYAEAMTPCSR